MKIKKKFFFFRGEGCPGVGGRVGEGGRSGYVNEELNFL